MIMLAEIVVAAQSKDCAFYCSIVHGEIKQFAYPYIMQLFPMILCQQIFNSTSNFPPSQILLYHKSSFTSDYPLPQVLLLFLIYLAKFLSLLIVHDVVERRH
jgi:hypothetical protein